MSESSELEQAKDILKLEEEISNFFEDFMYDRGGSPLLGRIYALCVLTDPNKPLTQNDLVNKFKVNPSTISRNLKELESWRLITRRREPGSREWLYKVDETTFLELIVKDFDDETRSLRERKANLQRIKEHWGETLSDESKKTETGNRALQMLDLLIEWISTVEKELESFIQNIRLSFLNLEKELQ